MITAIDLNTKLPMGQQHCLPPLDSERNVDETYHVFNHPAHGNII